MKMIQLYLTQPIHPLLRLALVTCLSLFHSNLSIALEPVGIYTRINIKPTAEEFAIKLAESKKEALRLYPDLNHPDSIFSRTAKLGEEYKRRTDPYYFEDHWNYPLSIAQSTSKILRSFSPHDPIFHEVMPQFTTMSGKIYSQLRVARIHRDGISVIHEKGTAFIHRDDLSDPQRDKYHTRWSTEVFTPDQLVHNVKFAIEERDKNLNVFLHIGTTRHKELMAMAKFDFEREYHEKNHELWQAHDIRKYCDEFSLRLFELAYAAQELSQHEALARIELELKHPVPEPYKTKLKELDEKIKLRNSRYKDITDLLRDKRCELLRNDILLMDGIPKRGLLGHDEFEIISPEYIRITKWEKNDSSQWVFKVDLDSGETTAVPEACKDKEGGTVRLRIMK